MKVHLKEKEKAIDYVKANPSLVWDLTIRAYSYLVDTEDLDSVTVMKLIPYDMVDLVTDIIIRRENMDETIDKALRYMEGCENYEICAEISKLKERNK